MPHYLRVLLIIFSLPWSQISWGLPPCSDIKIRVVHRYSNGIVKSEYKNIGEQFELFEAEAKCKADIITPNQINELSQKEQENQEFELSKYAEFACVVNLHCEFPNGKRFVTTGGYIKDKNTSQKRCDAGNLGVYSLLGNHLQSVYIYCDPLTEMSVNP